MAPFDANNFTTTSTTPMSSEELLRLAEEALRLCLTTTNNVCDATMESSQLNVVAPREVSPTVSTTSKNVCSVDTPTGRTPSPLVGGGSNFKSTLMLRNIPNRFTRDQLVKIITLKMGGKLGSFDFFYLPTDFRSRCNFGYAFINLTSSANVDKFFQVFNGANLTSFVNGIVAGSSNSNPRYSKICEVTFARVQGLEENVRRLMNSPIMGAATVLEGASQEEIDASLPILFDPVTGLEIPFPRPDASTLPSIMNPRASASLASPPHKKPIHKRQQHDF